VAQEKGKAKLLERLQVTNNGLKQLLEICDQDTGAHHPPRLSMRTMPPRCVVEGGGRRAAGKREELITRLAAFIETPTASGSGSIADKQAADKEKKAEKKAKDVAKKARKKELLAKKKAKVRAAPPASRPIPRAHNTACTGCGCACRRGPRAGRGGGRRSARRT
jgi:hypothetical protein